MIIAFFVMRSFLRLKWLIWILSSINGTLSFGLIHLKIFLICSLVYHASLHRPSADDIAVLKQELVFVQTLMDQLTQKKEEEMSKLEAELSNVKFAFDEYVHAFFQISELCFLCLTHSRSCQLLDSHKSYLSWYNLTLPQNWLTDCNLFLWLFFNWLCWIERRLEHFPESIFKE